MADPGKCAHEACDCSIDGDQRYCSDHCREAAEQDITEIACDCGHGPCS